MVISSEKQMIILLRSDNSAVDIRLLLSFCASQESALTISAVDIRLLLSFCASAVIC